MDADLVFAAGLESDFQQRFVAVRFKQPVVRDREAGAGGLWGGDFYLERFAVLEQVVADRACGRSGLSGDDGPIGFFYRGPGGLELAFCSFAFGEEHEAGGFLVQAMHHERSRGVRLIAGMQVLVQADVQRVGFFAIGGHGEQAGGFIDDDERVVFVN